MKPLKGILGESSPKRRVGKIAVAGTMEVEKRASTEAKSLKLGHYNLSNPDNTHHLEQSNDDDWEDEELYNSSRLSPIGADATETHELHKVTSYIPQSKQLHEPQIQATDPAVSTKTTVDTIEKVKKFIENKKKDLDQKRLATSPTKQNVLEKPKPKLKPEGVPDESERKLKLKAMKSRKLAQHSKNLRRLIHRIHKEPYDAEWNIVEWQMFQQYLNEWKLSGDDNMFHEEVLKDLFNCSVDELRVRAKSLSRLAKHKRSARNVK